MRGKGYLFKWYVVLFLVFLYAPAILLPVFAFNDSSIVSFPLKGFTTKWFEVLQSTEALHVAVRNSLMIAVTTAIFSTLFGVLAARASTRFAFPARRSIMGFIMLPMVLPEIIIGVSLLVVIIQLGFELSLFTIILGHILICTPFCIAILSSAFMNLDRSLEEASFDLGQTRWNTFWLVIFLSWRVHYCLLPGWDRTDPTRLYLGAIALSTKTAQLDGFGYIAAGPFDQLAGPRRLFPPAWTQENRH